MTNSLTDGMDPTTLLPPDVLRVTDSKHQGIWLPEGLIGRQKPTVSHFTLCHETRNNLLEDSTSEARSRFFRLVVRQDTFFEGPLPVFRQIKYEH